ncbi:MAG: efflux RND transporter periplasmic adaptor subunit [Rubrivivax sp.]
MSVRVRWLLVALVVVLALGGAITRALIARRAPPPPPPAPQALELAPTDVVVARRTELQATLPISGGLKAVNSAVVKAKVAAEVKQLLVREGDRVGAGQLIGRLDDTEYQWRLRQAEDQALAAQAQLEIAERMLANNKALVDQGFISKTALDTSLSSANGARASLQAARAAAELARKAVHDTELRAPLAGLVAQRLVQPGERVPVDARLVEIVDLSALELEAAIPPDDVVSLRVGQRVSVQVDGLAQPVAAQVARINPSTQGGTRSVLAYVSLEPAPGLRQGLFARGNVELQQRTALVVPAGAVRTDQSKPYVLVVEGGQARARAVELGARGEVDFGQGREAAVELLTGVADGQTVLRGTVGALSSGVAVVLPATRPGPAVAAVPASAPRP